MGNKRYFVINLIAQFTMLVSNMVVNFILTPYVTSKLGVQAYGFIGLINSFVSYTLVITVALNSLAGRYITLAYHRNETESAVEYYSSVFYANLFLSILVMAASIFLMFNANVILNVPDLLLRDVQITIVLTALSTIVSLLSVIFGIAAFIKNKLYLNSISQMIGTITRVSSIIFLFAFFQSHIWYYAIASLLSVICVLLIQRETTIKLCPEFKISLKRFKLKKVFEILKVGIWVSVESFNKILQTGLDLLISNIYVSVYSTGLLSLAKTVPNVLVQISGNVAQVFNPDLAKLYAEKKHDELIEMFNFTVKFLSILMIVPLIGFIAFGHNFYSLWLPQCTELEINLIQKISILTIIPLLVNAYVEGLYYANTLTNKVKGSVLFTLVFSIASIITEIVLLKFTNFNPLYIIAGTSSLFLSIRYLIVTPLYASHVLNVPYFSFFPSLFKAIFTSILLFILYHFISVLFYMDNWFSFMLICLISGIVGYILVFLLIPDSNEKSKIIKVLKHKLLRIKKGNN